ncbi:MAG: prephenate dehydrogenase/arogenate dehydrogenase family protein [Limnohabitans sp.]|nr:prephenate dehydrogenase/arogenate dehydrogenase family protein [Limnohabitans sp.]
MIRQLGLVGCGLMAGSFALALRRAGLVERIVAYSPSERTTRRALELGVIDQRALTAVQAVSHSDVVLLGVPVRSTQACLEEIRDHLAPDALLMDVGSTKGDVIEAAKHALGKRLGQFLPAHPIAGKELAGIDHADVELYRQRVTILTPLPDNTSAQIELARQLWQAVGSQVIQMDPQQHDAALAAVSHLPHVIAFAAVHALIDQAHGADFMAVAGPGFRDFSRIAASDPNVWRDILLSNRTEVLHQSRLFRQALAQLELAIEQSDGAALEQAVARARDARAAWPGPAGQPASSAK